MRKISLILKKRIESLELYYISEIIITFFCLLFFYLLYILHPESALCWFVYSKRGFSITYILLLNVGSMLNLIMYFGTNSEERIKKNSFINQSSVNFAINLLGTFYFYNWYSSGCTGYIGLQVIFYVLLSVPIISSMKLLLITLDRIIQKKLKPFVLKKSLICSIFSNTLFYEIILVFLIVIFFLSIPILHPKFHFYCNLGLQYSTRLIPSALFSLILVISNFVLIYSLLPKRTKNLKLAHLFQIRYLLYVVVILGIKYLKYYENTNCIGFSQMTWFMIKSIPWILIIPLILSIIKRIIGMLTK
ncbi:MAG: hypothetical protein H7641_05605 [Candidatus Heimdallarchaeota archaeon]|nr:hypothetical protein [Candidatus Heimdallarchaeota archaeon]MCK4877037.1 hypothetical protein [Candidatus Heimdallarchaeota archaeon]